MVKQFMTFSHRGEPVEQTPVEINALVHYVVSMCRKTFDRKIEINVEIPEQPLMVLGNAGQLEQILLNLCLNARDALGSASRGEPCIRIEVDPIHYDTEEEVPHPQASPGLYIRTRVSDNGTGMDQETQERVFEPFFTTKEAGIGTGLGLATAYAIVHHYHGWLEVQSQPGVGTTFAVYLPATEKTAEVKEEEKDEEIRGGTETILIIDDEEAIRNILAAMLEGQGYTVVLGADGRDGLEVFRREQDRIDLVLLDMIMPRMSGEEVLAEMVALDPEVKVVVSTGISAEELQTEAAKAILSKPYRAVRVLQTVRQVLDA